MKKILCLLLLLLPAPVSAQTPPVATTEEAAPKPIINQYDKKYKVKPVVIKSGRGDIIPQNKIGVYFVRAGNNPNEAVLRLSSPLSVNGCITLDQPPPTLEAQPPYLRVFLETPSIRLDKEIPQTTCQQAPQFIYSDITLTRDDLLATGINKLVLRNHLLSDTYSIDITSERIMLTPDTQVTFKPQTTAGKSNPLEFWFYPANTIILTVPKSENARETYELLKPLANEKNLITLGSVLPGFGQNLDQETRFYFVDETGALPKQMGDKNSIPFGEIQVTKTLTGMQGPYQVNETLPVFAMKPGYYD